MSNIKTYSFCDSYIDRLVDYIEKEYVAKNADLSRLAICFGGKRPALFVKRELARRLKVDYFPPRFFTIDELVRTIVNRKEPMSQGIDLDHCYLIYNLAKEHTPKILLGRETFAQFLPWTREILGFIDQLDLENIDEKKILNIQENAEIGYAVPDDINHLLENILVLRKVYHESLLKNKHMSRGLQYLLAGEYIKDVSFDEYDHFLFCNFFYFNASEEAIVKTLHQRNQATLLFQGDQRKWPVLQRISQRFKADILEGKEPEPTKFDLKLYAGFDAHSQVSLVREILKTCETLDNTVVVLPNPDHIVVLLSEITALLKEFNISMGYPLKRSSLYTLFEFIFKAQSTRKENRFYAKDYLKVLRHPFVKNLKLSPNPTITRILVHKLEEILTGKERASISGSLFLDLEDVVTCDELYMITLEVLDRLGITTDRREIQTVLEKLHDLVFESWGRVTTFKNFSAVLERFLDVLIQKSFLKNYPLNINIATKMYEIKDEFLNASFSEEDFPQEDIFKIFDSKVSREIVAFIGSPLKGLQMLGLFETRSLNFENVIILDVNEGALPRLNIYEPLIPREVMISLNLDRLELEEEIQRYQFMRLISSAKNVHLVYQERKDKERSRFIEELIWEDEKKAGAIQEPEVTHANFEVKVQPQKKVVKKTPQMIEALRNHKYSASSINTYLRNPMDFYRSYVLGLKEQDDLLDEPDARHVGTFMHGLLEHSFAPYLKKKPVVDSKFRTRVTKLFEQRFDDTFGKAMKTDSILLKSVIAERLNRFLDNEEKSASRQIEEILYLEHRFENTIALSCGDIRFGYIVDRVDKLKDGTIMILDYKTGNTNLMPRAIDRIATMEMSRENIRNHIKSFQIPLYFNYLHEQFKDKPINAALYNLRTLEVSPFLDKKMTYSREYINDTFLKSLDYILSEILNPEQDFEEDEAFR